MELDLAEAFKSEDGEVVLGEFEKSKQGTTWLGKYREFLIDHGWRCERMHAYDTPAWVEKPGMAIGPIKMMMVNDVFPADVERERVI